MKGNGGDYIGEIIGLTIEKEKEMICWMIVKYCSQEISEDFGIEFSEAEEIVREELNKLIKKIHTN